MPAVVVLFGLMLVAAATDIGRHKIYNWNTYPGILAGFIMNALGWGVLGSGREALGASLIGFALCGFVMLFCFVLFNIGGGDVKLIAMMGAFLGLYLGIEAMLWTFVIGSVMAAAILIWQFGAVRLLTGTMHHIVLLLRAKSWVPLTTEERRPLKRGLFLAPSGLVAVLIVTREQWWRLLW